MKKPPLHGGGLDYSLTYNLCICMPPVISFGCIDFYKNFNIFVLNKTPKNP